MSKEFKISHDTTNDNLTFGTSLYDNIFSGVNTIYQKLLLEIERAGKSIKDMDNNSLNSSLDKSIRLIDDMKRIANILDD